MVTIEEIDALAREPRSVVISVKNQLHLDFLKQTLWDSMGLVRVFTKRKGAPPDLDDPVVLSEQRKFSSNTRSSSITVDVAAGRVSKHLVDLFAYAWVWGTSVKFSPQRVGKDHILHDEDVLQIVTKTNNQQKQEKDYSLRVQNYNKAIAEKRRTRTKQGKKKRSTAG